MESTGVYWIPIFEILQERGLEVMVGNVREVKSVPGRKSDVNDAQWLQQLHQYGLLRASLRPTREIGELRSYLRQREPILDYAAAHIQHMLKALTQMNVQLHLSGRPGCRGSESGLAGRQIAPEHGIEESDRRSGRIRQRGAEGTRSGASRCNSIAFGILTTRRGQGEKRLYYNSLKNP